MLSSIFCFVFDGELFALLILPVVNDLVILVYPFNGLLKFCDYFDALNGDTDLKKH